MPSIADIYSYIDSLKRRGSDFIQNPGTSLQQMVGNANDKARAFNELNDAALDEFIATGDLYGPKNKELAQSLAGAYNPVGMTSPVFKTGESISFPFIKNTQKAPQLHKFGEDSYGQLVEPHGNYITSAHDVDVSKLPENYISGKMEFRNPLVLEWGKSGLYTEPDNWKQVLSKQYGGKKGKALSKAIAKDGYDGIVTLKDNEPSEIVDLSRFTAPK